MAKKQISGTNMVERAPRGKKATAAIMGAVGAALAATFIADVEGLAAAQERQQMSRKEKLEKILALGPKDLTAFHKAMLDRSDRVKADMEEAKKKNPLIKGLREYFELHPGQQTIYVDTSMWKTMAVAVDAGWKPDLSLPWANISASATAHKNAQGQPSTDPANPQPAGSTARTTGRGRGRQATTPQAKAINAVKSALKDEKGQPLPKNNRNLAEVIRGLLADATVEEMREVAAVVQTRLAETEEAAKKAQEAIDKAKSKQPEGQPASGEGVQHTTAGATVVHKPATARKQKQREEAPVASTGTRSRAKARA